VGISYLHV